MLDLIRNNLHFTNDLKHVEETDVIQEIQTNSHFSTTYLMLLIASSIICTLGLLLNAAPIVIGGMIISPVMWPLMKISLGVAHERRSFIIQGIVLLVLSIIIGMGSAMLITNLSPLKVVNPEILARTNPTALDIIVALAAGTIAALAVTQPKISESLAGVAIATSLMPPLCVGGIGVSLGNPAVFFGGFMLFIANVVSIIFVSILTFFSVGIHRQTDQRLTRKGLAFTAVILAITAIPLVYFLQQYAFRTVAYGKVETVLKSQMAQIAPSAYVSSVSTELSPRDNTDAVVVDADVLIPDGAVFDYQQQQDIAQALESVLHKKVSLRIMLQRTISVESQQNIQFQEFKNQVQGLFSDQLKNINSSFTVDSFDLTENPDHSYNLNTVLRGDPNTPFTYKDRDTIEQNLRKQTKKNISLNIEIISRIHLQSKPEVESQQIQQKIQEYLQLLSSDIELSSFSMKTPDSTEKTNQPISISLELIIPQGFQLKDKDMKDMADYLNKAFKKQFTVTAKLIQTTVLQSL